MATTDVQAPPAEPVPALPDYLTDPDAVLKDSHAKWRYGRAPDYSKTRKVFAETKRMSHEATSLPQLVENLVKNWEVEASFKPSLDDWRTIDPPNYSFAINGSAPQTAEHMLRLGTYNAIISPNEYYSPDYSDFASSHKTFKRMMPTFAWEVLEVYSGPPTVSFRWRHWGTMKNDYVGFNNKGEKVTATAHGGPIDIEGVTVATVDDKVRLQSVRTWFDPLDMFRQIAPNGVVKKEARDKNLSAADALDSEISTVQEQKLVSGEEVKKLVPVEEVEKSMPVGEVDKPMPVMEVEAVLPVTDVEMPMAVGEVDKPMAVKEVEGLLPMMDIETPMPVGEVGKSMAVMDVEKHLQEMGMSKDGLVEGMGCPFAGARGEEVKAPYVKEAGAGSHVEDMMTMD